MHPPNFVLDHFHFHLDSLTRNIFNKQISSQSQSSPSSLQCLDTSFLGNKVLLSQMVECLSDLALAKSAGGGWPVSYYQYRPLASMVLTIQATGQYGITHTGHWPVWY